MDSVKKRILNILVGAYWNMSGGDKKVAELISVWKNDDSLIINVLAPNKFFSAMEINEAKNLKLFDICGGKDDKKSLIIAYIKRTVKINRLLKNMVGDVVVYSSSDFFPDVIPAVLAKKRNKKTKWVANSHHIIEHFSTRPGNRILNVLSYYEQQFCISLMKKRTDIILYESPQVYDYLIGSKKIDDNKLVKVAIGVNVDYIDSLKQFDEEEKHYDIIMCARLKPSKGIFEIPAIVQRLKEKYPDVRVALIGEGDETNVSKLKELLEKHEVKSNISLLGYCSTEDVYRYIKSSKVFMLTSHEEGWGIVLAEAMTCRTAVVAYDLPIYEYVFGEYILKSELGDGDKIAKNIERLLGNENERLIFAQKARKFVVEHYDWKKLAEIELKSIL